MLASEYPVTGPVISDRKLQPAPPSLIAVFTPPARLAGYRFSLMKHPLEQATPAGEESLWYLDWPISLASTSSTPGDKGNSDNHYTRITITQFFADATARFLGRYKGVHCYSQGIGLPPLAKLLGSLSSKSRRATSDIESAAPGRSGITGFWDLEKHSPH